MVELTAATLATLARRAPRARRSDPQTSHDAARDASLGASAGRIAVLENLALRNMTDFELAAATGRQQTSIGKRRGECAAHGLVRPSYDAAGTYPMRRPAPSGSLALVWEITQDGLDFLKKAKEIA